jgi:hypothetical protein
MDTECLLDSTIVDDDSLPIWEGDAPPIDDDGPPPICPDGDPELPNASNSNARYRMIKTLHCVRFISIITGPAG